MDFKSGMDAAARLPGTNKSVGAQSAIGSQVNANPPSSGVLAPIDEIHLGLGNPLYDLDPTFAQVALLQADAADPQATTAYFPGAEDLTAPLAAQDDPPDNVYWDALELIPGATVEVDGVTYPELRRITYLPTDPEFAANGGQIPPLTHRFTPIVKKVTWANDIPVPPGVSMSGIVALINTCRAATGIGGQLHDLQDALGAWRVRGGQVTPSASGPLRVDVAEAVWNGLCINIVFEKLVPNVRTVPVSAGGILGLFYKGPDVGQEIPFRPPGPPNRDILNDSYAPDGAVEDIPAGMWTIHTLWQQVGTATTGRRLQLGEALYRSAWDAYIAAGKHGWSQVWDPKFSAQAPIALIAIKEGATGLDDNTQAMIFNRDFSNSTWNLFGDPPLMGGRLLQHEQLDGSTSDPDVVSATFDDAIPEMTIEFTPQFADSRLRVTLLGIFTNSISPFDLFLQIYMDGSPVGFAVCNSSAAGSPMPLWLSWDMPAVSTDERTIEVRWRVEQGTGTAIGTDRRMVVEEYSAL